MSKFFGRSGLRGLLKLPMEAVRRLSTLCASTVSALPKKQESVLAQTVSYILTDLGAKMKRRDGKLEQGDRVEVYRNLHNNTFSVRLLNPVGGPEDYSRWRLKGKVIKHLDNWMSVYLQNVTFAVQPAGREKVRREQKKNVHAFVRGNVVKAPDNKFGETFKDECTQVVQYNPYDFDTFVTQAWSSNAPAIHRASKVTLTQGTVYAAI
jgi:translation initiation factor IF-1